jgi:hypothetical protein
METLVTACEVSIVLIAKIKYLLDYILYLWTKNSVKEHR